MNCKNCNTNNNDGSKFCVSCGQILEQPQVVVHNTQSAPNAQNTYNNGYNVPIYNKTSAIIAIVVSVLCCGGMLGLVFAILSLVEGSKVQKFVDQGNIQAAQVSLDQAKKWNKIAWIVIAVCMVLMLLYFVFVFGLAFLEAL